MVIVERFNAAILLERLTAPSRADELCTAQPKGIGPDDLPSDWRVEWEERAAIREYDGGQAREYAEAEALREIVDRMRAAGEYP